MPDLRLARQAAVSRAALKPVRDPRAKRYQCVLTTLVRSIRDLFERRSPENIDCRASGMACVAERTAIRQAHTAVMMRERQESTLARKSIDSGGSGTKAGPFAMPTSPRTAGGRLVLGGIGPRPSDRAACHGVLSAGCGARILVVRTISANSGPRFCASRAAIRGRIIGLADIFDVEEGFLGQSSARSATPAPAPSRLHRAGGPAPCRREAGRPSPRAGGRVRAGRRMEAAGRSGRSRRENSRQHHKLTR